MRESKDEREKERMREREERKKGCEVESESFNDCLFMRKRGGKDRTREGN